MSFKRRSLNTKKQINIAVMFCLIVTAIEIINLLSGRSLNQLGLIPRDSSSLLGVLLAPLLHGSLTHYLSNIVPLGVFTFLTLQHGLLRFSLVTASCVVFSGGLVWLLGRDAIHIGASGLIYGYFGYLLLAGILSRELKLILISIAVGFIYGGLIRGILPTMPFVSWESHLFGFMIGIACSLLWARQHPAPKTPPTR